MKKLPPPPAATRQTSTERVRQLSNESAGPVVLDMGEDEVQPEANPMLIAGGGGRGPGGVTPQIRRGGRGRSSDLGSLLDDEDDFTSSGGGRGGADGHGRAAFGPSSGSLGAGVQATRRASSSLHTAPGTGVRRELEDLPPMKANPLYRAKQ